MEQVAVAMSGGVDSSVAAWLLKARGYGLCGVTMRLFPEAIGPDPGPDAAAVARQLDIPHHLMELEEFFRREIMDGFAAAYERGETPNPCVACNRRVKFGVLMDYGLSLDCERVATGHYVKSEYDGGSGRWLLKKADHREKDQSYFLCLVPQAQIARALFPLGGMSKEEIRAIALERGLVSARKKDSQDVCFIPDGDYAAFIRRHTGKDYPCGPFLDEGGACLGEHRGIIEYTVGQRRGLGISAESRLYVKEVRPRDNSVILSDDGALFSGALLARGLNLQLCDRLEGDVRLGARIRSRQREQSATVRQLDEDTLLVSFDHPQRAVTPGQAVALYDGDTVVGGAVIERGGEAPKLLELYRNGVRKA